MKTKDSGKETKSQVADFDCWYNWRARRYQGCTNSKLAMRNVYVRIWTHVKH